MPSRPLAYPAMGTSRDPGLAALWCLGLLGGLARVAGTHYRYLWRGCYPCHLGQAGYPVSAGDQRPGGRRASLGRGGRGQGTFSRARSLCFLFLKFAPGRCQLGWREQGGAVPCFWDRARGR